MVNVAQLHDAEDDEAPPFSEEALALEFASRHGDKAVCGRLEQMALA